MRNKIPCPDCNSNNTKRNGTHKPTNTQKVHCNHCHRDFRTEYRKKGYEPEINSHIDRLLQEGLSVRSVAKQLSLSPGKVQARRKQLRLAKVIENLNHEDWRVRYSAANTLGEIDDARDVPVLIEVLNDESIRVRGAASRVLGKMGKIAEAALIEALCDKDGLLRLQAALAFSWFSEPAKVAVPFLIKALNDEDEKVRNTTIKALGTAGDRRVVPALIEAIDDEKHPFSSIAYTLGKLGKEAEGAVLVLIEALKDKKAEVRLAAARALGEIGEPAEEAVTKLREALHDEHEGVRASAIYALCMIPNRKLFEILVSAMPDEDSEKVLFWRNYGAGATRDTDAELELLKAALLENNDEQWVIDSAVHGLAQILERANKRGRKTHAKIDTETLKICKKWYDNKLLREWEAIDKQGELFQKAISSSISSDEVEVLTDERHNIASTLDKLSKGEKDSVPTLIEALKNNEPEICWTAARILGEIGEPAKAAIPALIEALNDLTLRVREYVVWALGQIGDARAVPALIEVLGGVFGKISYGDRLNQATNQALVRIGKSAVTRLCKLFHDEREVARALAAYALGQFNIDNQGLYLAVYTVGRYDIRNLEELHNAYYKDASPMVRYWAGVALGRKKSENKKERESFGNSGFSKDETAEFLNKEIVIAGARNVQTFLKEIRCVVEIGIAFRLYPYQARIAALKAVNSLAKEIVAGRTEITIPEDFVKTVCNMVGDTEEEFTHHVAIIIKRGYDRFIEKQRKLSSADIAVLSYRDTVLGS